MLSPVATVLISVRPDVRLSAVFLILIGLHYDTDSNVIHID